MRIFFTLLFVASSCFAVEEDKIKHAAIGAGIGVSCYAIVTLLTRQEPAWSKGSKITSLERAWFCIMASFVGGLAIEFARSGVGSSSAGNDFTDIVATTVGGAAGSLISITIPF